MEFKPLFKENSAGQYYFKGDIWIKCSEDEIESLWHEWVISDYAHRYWDSSGFLVYGYHVQKATTI